MPPGSAPPPIFLPDAPFSEVNLFGYTVAMDMLPGHVNDNDACALLMCHPTSNPLLVFCEILTDAILRSST
jgi:hypothetical protein